MQRIFFLFIFFLTSARGQEDGESCIDENTYSPGKCTEITRCKSARNDFYQNLILPTLCSNNTFGDRIVCCRDGTNTLNAPAPDTDDRGSATGMNDRRRISERKCDEYSRSVVKQVGYIPLIPVPEAFTDTEKNCDLTAQLIGGVNVKLGEFPHMAAIGWDNDEGGYQFNCGGALISARFVLTTAHCIMSRSAQKPDPVMVRLGDQNIDDNVYDGANPVDVAIRKLHVHPNYNSPRVYDDIALLELAFNVKFGSAIRPACLWTKNDLGGYEKVIATRWGVVDPRTGQRVNELQKLLLPFLDVPFCNQTLKSLHTRNWPNGFTDSQMCVGDLSGGKDTCGGDSGDPETTWMGQVVSRENSCVFHIVGVTSFGKNCGDVGRPTVFTRVSSYINWIESIVWPRL